MYVSSTYPLIRLLDTIVQAPEDTCDTGAVLYSRVQIW